MKTSGQNIVSNQLSIEEKKELFIAIKSGDMEARRILIEDNIGLVYQVINRYFKTDIYGLQKEDVEQIGYIGLVNAVDTFDVNKGIQFSSYAYSCIKHAIMAEYKKTSRMMRNHSNNKSIHDPLTDDLFFEDVLSSDFDLEKCIFEKEKMLMLHELLNKLPENYKRVIYLRFGFSDDKIYTLRECGEILGITHEAVRQLEKKAINFLIRNGVKRI